VTLNGAGEGKVDLHVVFWMANKRPGDVAALRLNGHDAVDRLDDDRTHGWTERRFGERRLDVGKDALKVI